MTSIPTLIARLAAAQDELRRIEQADDLCHVSGAYARAAAVVRACQDDLIRAMAGKIVAECEAEAERLAAIEPVARDAMATPHSGA